MKISELTDKYLTEAGCHLRSYPIYERRILTLIDPYIGHLNVEDVDFDVLTGWVNELNKRGKRVAFNAKIVLSAVFSHGQRAGVVKHNIVRHFELPKKFRPSRRDKQVVLTDSEIVYLLQHLDRAVTPTVAAALRMVLFTAARPSEVLAMRRSQISGNKWVLPAELVKTDVEDTKCLNANALALIESLPNDGDELFPIQYITIAQALIRAQTPGKRRPAKLQMRKFTAHALRRSTATGLAKLGVEERTISAILNHALQGTTSRYVVHDYFPQKEAAMAKWAEHVEGLMARKKEVAA